MRPWHAYRGLQNTLRSRRQAERLQRLLVPDPIADERKRGGFFFQRENNLAIRLQCDAQRQLKRRAGHRHRVRFAQRDVFVLGEQRQQSGKILGVQL